MTIFKSGDLVVLKSGSPMMTIDTVNTDIFDDNKITGVLCTWFEGKKLERARFDHRAIELAGSQVQSIEKTETRSEITDDYIVTLGEVVAAMNLPTEEDNQAFRTVRKRSKSARLRATIRS